MTVSTIHSNENSAPNPTQINEGVWGFLKKAGKFLLGTAAVLTVGAIAGNIWRKRLEAKSYPCSQDRIQPKPAEGFTTSKENECSKDNFYCVRETPDDISSTPMCMHRVVIAHRRLTYYSEMLHKGGKYSGTVATEITGTNKAEFIKNLGTIAPQSVDLAHRACLESGSDKDIKVPKDCSFNVPKFRHGNFYYEVNAHGKCINYDQDKPSSAVCLPDWNMSKVIKYPLGTEL